MGCPRYRHRPVMSVPGLYDPTSIMNADQLSLAMREGWVKLAFYLLSFFYYLYGYRICSDSMAAIHALWDSSEDLNNDLSGALSLLSPACFTVVWVPGHAGITSNQLAHKCAREMNSRVPVVPWPYPPIAVEACFYKKTLRYKNLRHSFQTLPPPHPSLHCPNKYTQSHSTQ
ncbi:hypothetical protein HPB50_011015 [Hyalomma asiaticum]|uniref:Uncharacterized protein n=1 Tax=Hyalomma asiaticum TaxID=266040 RepID=A0ACB7RPD9_HYAAI|nr:hypothetical protein HPB50_011015 [Hyalomma asiaticum]